MFSTSRPPTRVTRSSSRRDPSICRRSRCRSSSLPLRPKLHVLAIILVLGTIARAQAISIQLDAGAFRVSGWQPPAAPPAGGWASIFNVYTATPDAPAMLGNYAVEDGTLV